MDDFTDVTYEVENGLEFYDHVSYLKAGLAFAERLTTVSPTYADEILTPEAEVEGRSPDELLNELIRSVEVPLR